LIISKEEEEKRHSLKKNYQKILFFFKITKIKNKIIINNKMVIANIKELNIMNK